MRSRLLLGLCLGMALSVPAFSEPVITAEPSALLTASAGYSADKAATHQTLSTAITAKHATASASASRLCGSIGGIALDTAPINACISVALGVGHPATIASRDRLDEEVDEGAYAERYLARGPGDDEDDDAARMSRVIASIPGDNEASGDGDIELPQAA